MRFLSVAIGVGSRWVGRHNEEGKNTRRIARQVLNVKSVPRVVEDILKIAQ